MLRIAIQGVRHNVGRYVATLVAIITGVAFFAVTGFVSARTIDALEGDATRQYEEVDAAVIPAETSGSDAFAEELRIPGDRFDAIAGVEGVDGAAGIVTGRVAFLGPDGRAYANDSVGRLWVDDETLNPMELVEGDAPSGAGEIVVDRGLAEDEDIATGDPLVVLTLAGEQDAMVVGIAGFGSSDSIDSNGTVFLSEDDAFDWLTSGIVEYSAIYLRSEQPQDELVAAVEPDVPQGFQVQAGEAFLQDRRDEAGAGGRFIEQGLRAFAVLALLVGGFVIFNTFNVVVSQRQRELAVMSAIGSTPRQIMSSVIYEGLALGVLGSVIGVAIGFAASFLLFGLFGLLGFELPGGGTGFNAPTVIAGLLFGTVITVASVVLPARQAARTEPIEALRTAAVEQTPFSRRRLVITLGLIVVGAAALLIGSHFAVIGLGAIALFIGVLAAGPMIAVFGAAAARPLGRLFGLEGRLAVDNTARNPGRTATTSNALLIGVFLVTLVSVSGESLKEFAVGEIKKASSADYLLESTGGTIDDELVSGLLEIDDVEAVVPFRRESVTLDGEAGLLTTGDLAALQDVAHIVIDEGSLEELAPGTIAVAPVSGGTVPEIGSTVSVADNAGDTEDFAVVAVLEPSVDTLFTGSIVVEDSFDALVGDTAPTFAFLGVVPGARDDTQDAIEDLTSHRPDVQVTEGNALGRLIGTIFDFLINAVNGLLGMSVLIASIGIVNTLSLSIVERRRELGLLRAVGMTDQRVRSMVRLESVVIAALGTLTGIALGLFMGAALILAINRTTGADIGIGLPVVRLVLILVIGPILGVLAALIPAWRSTKLDVLEALEPA